MDYVHPDTTMGKTVILLILLACSTCYAQPDTLWARNYQNYPLDICYSLSRTDPDDYPYEVPFTANVVAPNLIIASHPVIRMNFHLMRRLPSHIQSEMVVTLRKKSP